MRDIHKPHLRVALYARVSTEEQREGQTIDSQVTELESFIQEKGWNTVGVYKDEGWSGALMARPQLDRLRDDASKGLFRAVVLNDVDRLARDVAHLGVIKRDLERHRVQVIFRKLPSENNPTHNLMVNILGSFAEFEKELIADRTRRGKRHKVEVRKQYLGTRPPYGFRYIKKNAAAGTEGFLEVLAEEANTVRLLYSWVAEEGLSARGVVRRLNDLGIPPRQGGKSWQRSSVLRILRSEVYRGVWHYNKHERCEPASSPTTFRYRKSTKSSTRKRPRKDWIPLELPKELQIIEHGQWKRVQWQLNQNITFSPRNGRHRYLLKGLVRCGGCGASYVGDPCHGKFYYRCSKRCKKTPTIREDSLNEVVWDAVEDAVLHPEFIAQQVTAQQTAKSAEVRQQSTFEKEVSTSLKEIETEEFRILEAYRKGMITPSHLGGELEELQIRRNYLESQVGKGSERQKVISAGEARRSISDFCRDAARRIRSFSKEQKQRFLRLLIINIIYEGFQVRIKGRIPSKYLSSKPRNPLEVGPFPDGRIETTMSRTHARNPVIEFGFVKRIERREKTQPNSSS
jgi:site-specific DNA recombinase